MARQVGAFKLTGTIDNLVFYCMEGQYYVRTKSSIDGKRFWKDKAFAGSRKSVGLLGAASALASQLYRLLPKERKSRELFREITGKVKLHLASGAELPSIQAWFEAVYLPVEEVRPMGVVKKTTVVAHPRVVVPAPFPLLPLRRLPNGRRCRCGLLTETLLTGTQGRASPCRKWSSPLQRPRKRQNSTHAN